MKKLDIHRDTPEPSLEDMQKHMNFEDVLNRATSSPQVPVKGTNMKWWIAGGAAAIASVVIGVTLVSQINPTQATYESIAMEGDPITKTTSIEVVNDMGVTASNLMDDLNDETSSAVLTDPIDEIDTKETTMPSTSEDSINYYPPKVVSSIPFEFDANFGLKEQWQAFPELSIYDKLVFQPVDKLQSTLLNVHWESVELKKDENGQYFLKLIKGTQSVFCAVTPVFEKEDYVEALDAYQEHQ